jgi:tetratricopeptide (TPR) repeat protein
MEAARIRRRVEGISLAQAATGRVNRAVVANQVRDLRRAAERDPLDPGIPMLLAGQYMLLQRPEEAAKIYREVLDLEPRPETYLNLGRALQQTGDEAAARDAFERAVVLDWRLRQHVPH